MSGKIVYDRLVFYPGDEIFAEGDVGNWAYLIQSGEVAILKTRPDGSEEKLAVLGPGRVFGEMALIDDQPRMAAARATQESTLVLIDRYTFSSKVKKSDPFVRELLQNFTLNLRSMAARRGPAGRASRD